MFVFQKVRVWHRDCSAKISYFFHSCNRWYLFSSKYCIQILKHLPHELWTIPASQCKLQSRHSCLEEFSQSSKISVLFKSAIKYCDSFLNLLIFCVCSSPQGRIPCAGGSQTSRSTSWPGSHVLYSAAWLQKEVLQKLCNPRCCCKFLRNSSNRSMVPRMILRLGFVDLVDRVASSIWVQPVALLESSETFGGARSEFSLNARSK